MWASWGWGKRWYFESKAGQLNALRAAQKSFGQCAEGVALG